MKKNTIKEIYSAPETIIIRMHTEGFICLSGGDGNEEMGSGNDLGDSDFE